MPDMMVGRMCGRDRCHIGNGLHLAWGTTKRGAQSVNIGVFRVKAGTGIRNEGRKNGYLVNY